MLTGYTQRNKVDIQKNRFDSFLFLKILFKSIIIIIKRDPFFKDTVSFRSLTKPARSS